MTTFLAFLKAIPELVKLVSVLMKAIEEAGVERHVAQDVKTIHEAFTEKNPEKLNALFRAP